MQPLIAAGPLNRCRCFSVKAQRVGIPGLPVTTYFPAPCCAIGRHVAVPALDDDLTICYGPDGGVVEPGACTSERHANSCLHAVLRGGIQSRPMPTVSPQEPGVPLDRPHVCERGLCDEGDRGTTIPPPIYD